MNALIASFQSGELSPLLEGRGDLEALRSGCLRMRNVIPLKLGAAFQRPGLLYRGRVHDETKRTRILGYAASSSVAYQIELSEFRARFWKDGALVVTQSGIPGGSGVLSAVGQPLVLETPWNEDEIFELQIASANDVLWVCHRNHWPRRLVRHGLQDWRIGEFETVFPPVRDVNAEAITVAASGTTGSVNLTAVGGNVFTSGDVGGYYAISHRRDLPLSEINLSEGGANASGVLSMTAQPADGEQISIGDVVYTAKTTISAANHVLRGADLAAFTANCIKAVNGEDVGTACGAGTVAHPDVTAEAAEDIASGTQATATLAINNQLVAGATITITIGGSPTSFTAVSSGAGAGQFNLGANKEGTLDNIVTSVNAAALAVTFAARVGNQAVLSANAAGSAGNSIAVARNTGSGASLNWLQWSGATLSGGADSATKRVRVAAKLPGADGNGIALAETLASGSWAATATAGGVTISRTSDTLRINGGWEVFSYGTWYGTICLKLEREPGVWETIRAWNSKNDFNIQSSGTVEGLQNLRLEFTGTGTEADGAAPRAVLSAVDAMVTGLVEITGVTNGTTAAGTVIRELHSTDATYDWAEGAWSDRRGYPSAVALHEQRLYFGRDNMLWGSETGGFDDFERLPLEDAALAYNVATTQGNRIVALLSHRGLVVLTDGDEWMLDGGPQSATITPSHIRAERKSGNGSASVAPVAMQSSVFFVEQGGSRLNEYVFDFQQDGYEAVDLTELAEHFGEEKFVCLAWAPNPHGVLWAVTESGSLLSMTFRRKAGIIAWAKHETREGVFESVCVTPGAGGVSDVTVTVRRTIDGGTVRSVEQFDNGHWTKVHSGGDWINVADGAVVVTTPASVVSGLDHLEGQMVGVLVDGAIHPDCRVQSGAITLDEAFETAAVVGLPPVAELQPMPLEIALRDGSSTGRKFRAGKVDVRFYRTNTCEYAATETSKFYEVAFRSGNDEMDAPVPPFTGLMKLDIAAGFEDGTRVILRNRSMLPLHVLGMVIETNVHGD